MKYIAILAACVVALLLAWAAWGPSLLPSAPPPYPHSGSAKDKVHVPLRLYLPVEIRDAGPWVESAQQLWNGGAMRHHPAEFARLIGLVGQSLDEEVWRGVMPAVYFAWDTLRRRPEGREALKPLQEELLSRFVRSGRLEYLERLARVVVSGDAENLDADTALVKATEAPLPESGYPESPQALVIAARLRARDFDRAGNALDGLLAREDVPDAAKELPRRLRELVRVYVKAKAGSPAMGEVVGAWSRAHEELAGDPVARDVARGLLEEVGRHAVQATGPTFALAGDYVRESAGDPAAGEYWRRAVRTLMIHGRETPLERTRLMEALAKACEERFRHSASEIWEELTDRVDPKRENYSLRLDYLRRAIAATADEARRVSLALRAVDESLKVTEFGDARATIEEVRKAIAGEEGRRTLDRLREDVAVKETADRERAARQAQEIEAGRHRAQLQYMRERLAEARKQGRSPEDIASIERVVRELEKKSHE